MAERYNWKDDYALSHSLNSLHGLRSRHWTIKEIVYGRKREMTQVWFLWLHNKAAEAVAEEIDAGCGQSMKRFYGGLDRESAWKPKLEDLVQEGMKIMNRIYWLKICSFGMWLSERK